MRKIAYAALVLASLGLAALAVWRFTPWPSALLIRQAFDRDAIAANDRLAARVPPGLRETLDLGYLPEDPDARLDLYLPPEGDGPFPVVVWVHGGVWISGSKYYISNYLRLIAAEGFAVAGIDYSIAPGAKYPTPVVQTNAALAWLADHAADLRLDPARLALAGDSAGAQIAAQTTLVLTDPAYAARTGLSPGVDGAALRGLILHCGGLDATNLSLEGAFGSFLRTVLWSYLGTRDVVADPRLTDFSIPPNLHAGLPPIFISAGNADPLEAQSRAVAERAAALGVPLEALFFPADYAPPLGHEYQFDLATEAGQEAFARSMAFLDRAFAR
jgi:acetyl esterase/lipase